MAVRDGSPGLNGAAKGPRFRANLCYWAYPCLPPTAGFDPQPRRAVDPFGKLRRQVRRMKLAFDKVIEKRPARRPSHRLVTDGFDVVAVRIEDECAIVVGVVVRTKPRYAIVFSSGVEARAMKSVNLGARPRGESDMDVPRQTAAIANPEEWFTPRAEASMGIAARLLRRYLHHKNDRERRKRPLIESLGPIEIGNRNSGVIEHFVPP